MFREVSVLKRLVVTIETSTTAALVNIKMKRILQFASMLEEKLQIIHF